MPSKVVRASSIMHFCRGQDLSARGSTYLTVDMGHLRSPNPPINCLTGCLAALVLSRLVALVRSTTGNLVKKGSHDL